MRGAEAGVLSGLLLTGVATAAEAAGTAPASAASLAAVRADWGPSPWSQGAGAYGGQYADPWSGTQGTSATAVSNPASTAQSRGVVMIDTVLGYQSGAAAGTGMVLTSSGEVLTNYHVVEGSTSITATVASTGRTYRATVVGSDAKDDIAVLRLTGASGLSTVKVDTGTVATGQAVTAVGNAGGTGSLSAATGSVTSVKASVTTAAEDSVASETLAKMLETDADVVAGDSGGPLYDAQGEVVGIDTAASTGTEIDGYAIPIRTALAVVHQIEAGKQTGTVRIGRAAFLGVELGQDDALSQDAFYDGGATQGVTPPSGAVVDGVIDATPAAAVGLAAGDTITAVGGSKVSTAAELTALLAGHRPGDRVRFSWVDASGAQHSATVTLTSSPVA